MSSLFDMISSFIALLMSAAFLHFGAAGGEEAVKVDPPVATSQKATEQSSTSPSANAADWQAKSANQPETDTTQAAKAIRQTPARQP